LQRSGQIAAMMSAVRAPQSKPAMVAFSIFSASKAAREQPNFLGAIRNIAASSALSGHLDEAQKALARVRRLDPELRLSNLKNRVGPYRPADFARFAEGMRLAGLPE